MVSTSSQKADAIELPVDDLEPGEDRAFGGRRLDLHPYVDLGFGRRQDEGSAPQPKRSAQGRSSSRPRRVSEP